ncbi:hypothetical protein K466DRAFT_491022 [Polyporus arcularius HHB13444]|uniref:DUF6593 domain-containing protein n=2 Tax=Polyporaceae TaxID=5317 RepID=A0A5C3PFG6_9APHY|nr:hypothetical protein OH76DRAFT_1354609 [Polyporus brumalis]TFK87358.1 hypothetical protein K466DRAFT_491022 [Polyporus arcularius HHB13444]
MNPYGQQWQQGGAAPSIFGALPSLPVSHAPRAMQSDSIMFSFTDFKTTILNCTVVGPQGRTAYRIITEPAQPACTIVKDNESKSVAMIQWQPAASLEVRGVTNRQRVRDWLRLSPDQSRRFMDVQGAQYAWAPMEGFICLYKVNSSAPRVLARIARMPNAVMLELTQEAVHVGLLEASLVATVMLSCGHNID